MISSAIGYEFLISSGVVALSVKWLSRQFPAFAPYAWPVGILAVGLLMCIWVKVRRTGPEVLNRDDQTPNQAVTFSGRPSLPPSKLKIHHAEYRAINGQGLVCDVSECLQKMVCGDALVLQIENDNFQVGGRNYVPNDPLFGVIKQLEVTYSFDGVTAKAVRQEHARFVLPEDSFLTSVVASILSIPFSSLQMEAFQIAKALQNFLTEERASFPKEIDPSKEPLSVVRSHSDERIEWRKRTESKYQRRFAKVVDDILLKFGEVGIGIPPSFAPLSSVKRIEEDIPRLTAALIAMAHRMDGVVFRGPLDDQ